MSRRISNWNFFKMMNACLLVALMVTAVPTSSAIRRIKGIPRFGGIRNRGFGDFASTFPGAFSIGGHIPGRRRPKAFSFGGHIPGVRRPGRPRANTFSNFDLQTASSLQQNSYILPPPSFQSNFNPAKPIALPPSSSLMFMTALPNGYKSSSDIFDAEESISIGKLEAFLIHGKGEKPNPKNFQIHLPQRKPHIPRKQRPRQPTEKPIISSESLKLLDHGSSTNLIIPFQNSFHDIHKNNFEFEPKRKPNNRPPPRLPQRQQRPQNVRGERITHVPLPPPVSRPKELHIIIHNSPPIQQSFPKDIPPHLPGRQHNYGTQTKPPLQVPFGTGHSSLQLQTEVSIPQNHNHQSLQGVYNNNNNRAPSSNHAPQHQMTNSVIIPHQVSNIPSPQDTRQESTLFIQPNFASSLTPQITLLPPSTASNPNVQVNAGSANYAGIHQQPPITYNPPTTHQVHSTHPVQQQTAPVVQHLQQSVQGNQQTPQNIQQNYISAPQNDQRVLQQNIRGQQTYVNFPQNTNQNYVSTLQDGQRVLQNTQQNYVSTLPNDQKVLPQNVQPNYISSSYNDPNVLLQTGAPTPPSLVSSVQSTHLPLSQNGQTGHSTSVQYKQAVSVQQVNPSHQISIPQYQQGQQTYLPASQNFAFSSASQPSALLSQGDVPQNIHSPSQQNDPSSAAPNVHQSYISTSGSAQVGYGSPGETAPAHLADQRDYSAASQNFGTRTVTHSIEQQSLTGSAQPPNSEKHSSQKFTLVQSTSDQKVYTPQSQSGQFYTATNHQETTSYVPATKTITFTVNPSSQTTAKYVLVKPSGNANNAGNNVVYNYKPQTSEAQGTSSLSASVGYVTPGSTYKKDLSNESESDSSYERHSSSTSVSSNTFTKNSGGSEDETFSGEESANNSSYKVVYIPLDILKHFLSKGAGVNNQ